MAYSAVAFENQDAGKTLYDLVYAGPAPGYLDTTHVVLFRDQVEQVGGFTFNTPTNVVLATATIAGEHIMFRRITPKDQPLVDFELDTVLTDVDLDVSTLQSLYIAHEILDGFITLGAAGYVDVNNKRIINLADGILSTDAVNKTQLDQSIADTLAASIIAAEAAVTAVEQVEIINTAGAETLANAIRAEDASDAAIDASLSAAAAAQDAAFINALIFGG